MKNGLNVVLFCVTPVEACLDQGLYSLEKCLEVMHCLEKGLFSNLPILTLNSLF